MASFRYIHFLILHPLPIRASVIEINYPHDSQTPQCLITVPHASHGGDFFDNFPQIFQAFSARKELLERFLRLECDVGSQNLAHTVGQYLDLDHKISTRVLFYHHIHRGIVDPNRLPEHAVRPVMNYDLYPGLRSTLEVEHLEMIRQVRECLARIPNLSRIVALDMHTMAPYTPAVDASSTTEAATLNPDNMEAYIRAFTDPQFRGARRPIDILTAVPGVAPVGDPTLIRKLQESLSSGGFASDVNNPYPLSPVLMSTEIVRQTRGVALDVPKPLLTQTTSNGEADLTNLEIDITKVGVLGRLIAAAIAETIQER